MAAHPEGGNTYHLSNIDQSMTYRDIGLAIARAGQACVPVGYAAFQAEVVNAAGSPLRPLASYFPEAGFAMHMGPWPNARTRAELAALGVACPAVGDRVIAAYLEGLVKGGRAIRP